MNRNKSKHLLLRRLLNQRRRRSQKFSNAPITPNPKQINRAGLQDGLAKDKRQKRITKTRSPRVLLFLVSCILFLVSSFPTSSSFFFPRHRLCSQVLNRYEARLVGEFVNHTRVVDKLKD